MSGRVGQVTPNAIAVRRAELSDAGMELTDLTDTNPTHHGLFDPEILDVLARHLPRSSRYEPSPGGPWPARAALADRYGGDPDDYWLTASTSEAYGWLFCLLADAGDQVAIGSPGYPLIEPLAYQHDLTISAYRTFYVHPSGWELDRASLEDCLDDPKVRAVVAVNPNNPTGSYTDVAVAEIAGNRGLPLIADEVFFPFRLSGLVSAKTTNHQQGAHQFGHSLSAMVNDDEMPYRYPARQSQHPSPTMASGRSCDFEPDGAVVDDEGLDERIRCGQNEAGRLSGNDSRVTFGLDGLSKLLAAPQLKLAWIRLSGPTIEKRRYAQGLDQIADTYLSVANNVALALPDLLNLADGIVAAIIRRLEHNLATAQSVFSHLRVRTSYGGWMMLLDVPPIMEAESLCLALMERAGLYVHPGYFYDLPDCTLALSLLPQEADFQEMSTRLAAGLAVLNSECTQGYGCQPR